MAILNSQLAQLVSRLGVLRLGTGRLGAALPIYEQKPVVSGRPGEVIWNRPVERDGDPDDTVATFTHGQE